MDTPHDLHGLAHMKLDPKHERVIMLLGALAGIVGLFLLLKSHETSALPASAAAGVSGGISSTGIGSSAGAYGTSQDASDLSALLRGLSSGGTGISAGTGDSTTGGGLLRGGPVGTGVPVPVGVTSAGGPASPGVTTTGYPSSPGSDPFGAYTPIAYTPTGGATPDPLQNLPQSAAPSANSDAGTGGGLTLLENSGNTTYNINSSTNTSNTTNIIGSFNTGNNWSLLGSPTPNTLPIVGGMQGGMHLPITSGGGISLPPPVGITHSEPHLPVLATDPVIPPAPIKYSTYHPDTPSGLADQMASHGGLNGLPAHSSGPYRPALAR